MELHFDELGTSELETIIERKCEIPKKMSKKMIRVLRELQVKRRASAAFQGKRGFITLRDLFRWAFRYGRSGQIEEKFYDWDLHMAEEGFLVLASRIRNPEEVATVRGVVEAVFKKKIDEAAIFSLDEPSLVLKKEMSTLRAVATASSSSMVWTRQAVRMAALVLHSFKFREPVLLIGETGCGKTSVCQTVTEDALGQAMATVNCHLNTEASDFLGGLRPCRNATVGDVSDDDMEEEDGKNSAAATKLLEWSDGPLVKAMLKGMVLLVDEISLADDSVIERANSVLEEEKRLLLPERRPQSDLLADEK